MTHQDPDHEPIRLIIEAAGEIINPDDPRHPDYQPTQDN